MLVLYGGVIRAWGTLGFAAEFKAYDKSVLIVLLGLWPGDVKHSQ